MMRIFFTCSLVLFLFGCTNEFNYRTELINTIKVDLETDPEYEIYNLPINPQIDWSNEIIPIELFFFNPNDIESMFRKDLGYDNIVRDDIEDYKDNYDSEVYFKPHVKDDWPLVSSEDATLVAFFSDFDYRNRIVMVDILTKRSEESKYEELTRFTTIFRYAFKLDDKNRIMEMYRCFPSLS